jgi:Zn-finger nucleic acid-binding protein
LAVGLADKAIVANCVNCGGALRIDRARGILVCDHCGSQREAPAFAEQLEFHNETSSLCPGCSTPLSTSRLEGHPLLCCARCFGMLIAMDRFAALIETVRFLEGDSMRAVLPRRQTPTDRVIDCPSCRRPMLAHVYAGPGNVVIDTCERCHLNWLDPGELRRIASAPDRPRRAEEDLGPEFVRPLQWTSDEE